MLLRCTHLSSTPGLDILQEGASGPGSFRKGRRYTPFLSRKASLASPGLFFCSSQLHYGQDRCGGGWQDLIKEQGPVKFSECCNLGVGHSHEQSQESKPVLESHPEATAGNQRHPADPAQPLTPHLPLHPPQHCSYSGFPIQGLPGET